VSVLVLFDAHYQPDRADEVIQAFAAALPATRAFDGCLEVSVQQDQDDPGHIVLVERWASREHHKAYMAWRTGEGATGSDVGTLMTARPTITYFDDAGI